MPAQVNNVLGERWREAMPMPVAGSGQGEGSGLCRRGGAGGAPLPRPLPHPAERVLVMASFGTEVNGVTDDAMHSVRGHEAAACICLTAGQALGQGAAHEDAEFAPMA